MTKKRTVSIDHTHEPATTQYAGFMGFDDKIKLEKAMFLDGINSNIVQLTFSNGSILTIDQDKQIANISFPDGTTANIPSELWYSQGKATESIAEGDNVMLAGSQGDHYLVKKAVASELALEPWLYLGVATKASATNEWVKITKWGLVNNINMNSWAYGTKLYFDPSTNGFTSTLPSLPNARIKIGMVVKTGTSTGILLVDVVDITLYTNSEIDALLSAKSNVGHTHDERYFTESEINTFLASKQDSLISGINIKTINGSSILGSGDLSVSGVDTTKVLKTGDSMTGILTFTNGDGIYGGILGGLSRIWAFNSTYPGIGIYYNEATPDSIRMDVSGQAQSGTPDFEISTNVARVNGFDVLTKIASRTSDPLLLEMSDGTIIKSGTGSTSSVVISTAVGSMFRMSSDVTVTFNTTSPFTTEPKIALSVKNNSGYLFVVIRTVTTTNFTFNILSPVSMTTATPWQFRYIAIGN